MSGLVTMVLMVNTVCSLPTQMLQRVKVSTKDQEILQIINLLGCKELHKVAGRMLTKTLVTVPGKLMTLLTNLS